MEFSSTIKERHQGQAYGRESLLGGPERPLCAAGKVNPAVHCRLQDVRGARALHSLPLSAAPGNRAIQGGKKSHAGREARRTSHLGPEEVK